MKRENKNERYRKLYNEHPDHIELRTQTGKNFEKYNNDVLYWKLKYIEKLVQKNINKDQIRNVAEIGCATGFLLNNFGKNLKCNKTGIDISNEDIKFATKMYPSISFYDGTFNDFIKINIIKKSSFDLIILSDILEHVEEDVTLLKKAGKYSKNVIVNIPIEKVPEYEGRIYGIKDKKGHLRAYDINDAFTLFKNAQMEVLDFFNKRYVKQAVFRKYLLDKLLKNNPQKIDALVKFQIELINIDLNSSYYKSNFFALLKSKG